MHVQDVTLSGRVAQACACAQMTLWPGYDAVPLAQAAQPSSLPTPPAPLPWPLPPSSPPSPPAPPPWPPPSPPPPPSPSLRPAPPLWPPPSSPPPPSPSLPPAPLLLMLIISASSVLVGGGRGRRASMHAAGAVQRSLSSKLSSNPRRLRNLVSLARLLLLVSLPIPGACSSPAWTTFEPSLELDATVLLTLERVLHTLFLLWMLLHGPGRIVPSSHVVGYLIVFVLLKAAASTMPEPISDKTHQPLSAAERLFFSAVSALFLSAVSELFSNLAACLTTLPS
eukprot:scaffold7612_cov66-Phaeocystis_antarctica.AAC.1